MKIKLNQVNDDWVAGFIKQCEAMDIDPVPLITEWIKVSKPVFKAPGSHRFSSKPGTVASKPTVPTAPAPAPKAKPEPAKSTNVLSRIKSTINKGVRRALALGGAGTVGYQIAKDKYQEEPW